MKDYAHKANKRPAETETRAKIEWAIIIIAAIAVISLFNGSNF